MSFEQVPVTVLAVILLISSTAAMPTVWTSEDSHKAVSRDEVSSAAKLVSDATKSKSSLDAVHGSGEDIMNRRERGHSEQLDSQMQFQSPPIEKHTSSIQDTEEDEPQAHGVYNQQIYPQKTLPSSILKNNTDQKNLYENVTKDLHFHSEKSENAEGHGQHASKGVQTTIEDIDETNFTRNSNDVLVDDAVGHDKVSNSKHLGETSDALIKRLCNVQGKKEKVCYEEHGIPKCRCNGGLADCSGTKYVPNLSYAPKLPQDIKCLKFRNNDVRHFTDSYFANVSNFLVIDFSSNTLLTVSEQTFERLTNLQYLILNYNAVSYKYLKYVLTYPPKLRLDIVGLGLREIPEDYFYHFSDIPTSQIYMDFNYIPNLQLKDFAWLDNLQYLSLTNCSIQRVYSAPMKSLSVLDLSNNNIVEFPVTCNNSTAIYYNKKNNNNILKTGSGNFTTILLNQSKGTPTRASFFPSLTQLMIGVNEISALPPYDEICLPRVTLMNMNSNNISEIGDNAFTNMGVLEVLILDKMKSGITNIGRSPFNISTLTSLHLTKNKIDFSSEQVSKKLFEGCTRLIVLHIDHNQFASVSDEAFTEILSHTPQLLYLYLGSNGINYIPVNALSQLSSLIKLYIFINAIKEIPPGAFDNMPSLQNLYMDQNQVSTVKQNAFSEETISRLKAINLSKNDFMCNCDLLWFRDWLRKAGPDVFMDYTDYKCSDRPLESVQEYVISVQACLFSRQVYVLFVVCLSIFITVFLVFSLVYRYRWSIRLLMYERRAANRVSGQALDQERNFQYDLFIVYSNDDCEWVEDLLLPVLENRWNLKVCIHQRDFVAGGSIFDNIADAMNSSRRILAVISSRFALSRWCNSELQLCQSHVITHDLPSLLVVKLDDIESRDMSAAMLALYNTTCFLEWPSDAEELTLFWKRLRHSLRDLITRRSQEDCTSVMKVNDYAMQSL